MSLARAVLAAGTDDQQKAAPLGLFVLLLLGVACYFLFKSMSRHLKRVRDDFPAGSTATGAATTRPTAAKPVSTEVTGSAPGALDRSDSAAATPDRARDDRNPQ